jgi:serine/threonine-protein kinase
MGSSGHVDAGVHAGDVLAGKYRVERVLGVGGMGVVVAAHHLQLDEKVALKFLLPRAVYSEESLSRFLREARAAAKIKNEHVARVIDVGQLENKSPYMVMEFLDGSDLADWLRQHGAMSVEQAVDFVLQACEALAEAHALGIVHRDLKPANLFCVTKADGQLSIKVLDFGISKITTPGAPGHDMTKTTALMGSPLYMSPEQMQLSKGVDARTDIWALGVILFELLTGQPPFTAAAVTELAIKVANEPAPGLRSFRFDAPEGLEPIIATCLAKDRAARFQTVGELAIALREFGSRRARASVEAILGTLRKAGMSAPVLPPSGGFQVAARGSASAVAGSAPNTSASWGQTASRTKSGRKALALIAVAAVVGITAVGGLLLVEGRRSSTGMAPERPPAVAVAASASTELPAPSSSAVPSGALAHVPTVDWSSLPVVLAPAAMPARPAPRPVASVVGTPTAATVVPPSTMPAAAPSATPKAGCNAPYTIDSAGHRQYKPECL